MSSHYEPIPTDSDDENDHVSNTAPMSGNEARSDRTRSTDRSQFFHQDATDSEEEPEEDDPISTDPRSPLPTVNSEMRSPIMRTARARAAMPNLERWTRSGSPTPSTDPYIRPPPGFQIWERTLRTLQRWRDRGQYTPIPEEGGSSSVRQEFLLDTTPIIVDKIARHEERLDMMEDVIMDMPGGEAFGELQDQVNNAEENISSVNDTVQSLKAKLEKMTREFKNMENTMNRQVGECHTMTAMAQGFTQDRLREFFENGGK